MNEWFQWTSIIVRSATTTPQRVLPDTGAYHSYIDPVVVKRHHLPTSKRQSYHPIGADGKHLPQVTHSALYEIWIQ